MNSVASTILSLVVSQMNPVVGDIEGNLEKMMSDAISARDNLRADLIVFPESSILGYPPYRFSNEEISYIKISKAIDKLKEIKKISMVVGVASLEYDQIIVINDGAIRYEYVCETYEENKAKNQSFKARHIDLYKCKNSKIGFLIGDDIKNTDILSKYKNNNADMLISLNSPIFHTKSYETLLEDAKNATYITNAPVVCCCLTGCQDQYIFTGGSFVIDKHKEMVVQASYLREQFLPIEFIEESRSIVGKKTDNPEYNSLEMLYSCLVSSLHDYVYKNGFSKVVLGLSGGVDSALVATIAVDALGKDNVIGVMMPYKYTSSISIELANILADNLDIELKTIAIHEIYNVVADKILESCRRTIKSNTDSGNLQARSRALVLMTIANTHNAIVLNTGNKSEVATGYFTIYGDSIGGFAVLADVFKTNVYELAIYRNEVSKVIPEEIISRKPTAELHYGQLDQDHLPRYKVLDKIIKMYLKGDDIEDIVDKTHEDIEKIQKVLNMINKAEYKRYQAPIAPLVDKIGFDKDANNFPVTNKWKY